MAAIHTLGDLRKSGYRSRSVKQEIRDNLGPAYRIEKGGVSESVLDHGAA